MRDADPVVLDASALLALVRAEAGSDEVAAAIPGAVMSAVNWSEFVQKVLLFADDGRAAAAEVRAMGVEIEPLTPADAERAAELWFSAANISLADRCCLATAERLRLTVVTADRAWSDVEVGIPVVQIR